LRRWSGRILVAFVLCLAALTGFAGVKLSHGPLTVPFLAGLMGSFASKGPANLTVLDAAIALDDDTGLKIVVRDAHLSVAGETPVSVFLPHVEAPLQIGPLLSGDLRFHWLTLERPRVRLTLAEAGAPDLPDMAALVEAIDRVSRVVDDEFSRRSLESIKVENGEVVLEGSVQRRFSGIDASVVRTDGNEISAEARVGGQSGPWDVAFLRRTEEQSGGNRRIALFVRDITVREFMEPDAPSKSGAGLGLPLQLTFDSYVASDGTFLSANTVARIQRGWVQMGRTTVQFQDAALSLLWEAGASIVRVLKSHVHQGNTRIEFDGHIEPPGQEGGAWAVRVKSENARFGSADIPEPPLRIDGAWLQARVFPSDRSVLIDSFRLRAGEADALVVGSVDIADDGPYLALAANAKSVPVALAKQIWPITLVPPAREWVIKHLHEGLIEDLSFTGAVRPPAFNPNDPDPGWGGDDMTMDMRFSGGRISPVGDVPDAVDLAGTLSVADETLTLSAKDARMDVGTEEDTLQIQEVSFQIFDLPLRVGKTARIDALLDGEVKDLSTVIDSAPFKVLERAGLQNKGVSGESSMRVEASFPLEDDIRIEDVDWAAEAVSRNFSSEEPINGQTIQNANVTLRADPTQISINGRGNLNGFDADIDLQLPLGGSNVEVRQGVGLTVTAEQLREKGVDLTAFLRGPMRLEVRDADDRQEFEIDLKDTRVAISALGWSKERGAPAQATFTLLEDADTKRIEAFQLQADGVDVAGSVDLTADGDLSRLSFERFQLRPDDSASLSVSRSGSGYQVAIRGERFDARGLIRQMRADGSEGGENGLGGSLEVSADIDRVMGFNGARIDNLEGQVTFSPTQLRGTDLKGLLNGREPFEFKLQTVDGGRRVDGVFGDTGTLLKFLDLYERMRGGYGNLTVSMASDTNWSGIFSVRNLSITNDPAIETLRQRRDLFETDDAGRVLIPGRDKSGGDAGFETLEITFTRAGDVLTITRGALQGAVFGGTVSGTVNLLTQNMDLTGTFVPIYALNNIFANIPILGFALGGGSGEGLLGVTYRVSGPLTEPVLSVNPVSAIAPGIFRKMFEFQ